MSGTLTAYPPEFIGPIGEGYRCNESEWVASTLNRGDRCWFRCRVNRRFGVGSEDDRMTPWTPATFMSAMFYDGVIAKVYEDDPDDLVTHSLFCDMGDELRDRAPSEP